MDGGGKGGGGAMPIWQWMILGRARLLRRSDAEGGCAFELLPPAGRHHHPPRLARRLAQSRWVEVAAAAGPAAEGGGGGRLGWRADSCSSLAPRTPRRRACPPRPPPQVNPEVWGGGAGSGHGRRLRGGRHNGA